MRILSILTFHIVFLSMCSFGQIPTARLQAWYVGDSVLISDDAVQQWSDISGNGYHLIQNTISRRPLQTPNAFGGHAVINFDGVNDYLQVIFGTTFSQPITIFIVWRINTLVAQEIFDGLSDANALVFNYPYNGNTTLRMYAGATFGISITYSKPISPNFTISSLFFTNPDRLYDNGVLMGQYDVGNNSLTGFNVGTRNYLDARFMDGDIAEFIFYDTLLNESERVQVETYLMDKYAPPVDLGSDINVTYGFCSTELGVSPDFTSVLWSTGSTDDTISVNQTGSYWVLVTDVFGRSTSDTVLVQYPNFSFQDTLLCYGDSVSYYSALSGDYAYLWSDTSTDSLLNITEAGSYWLKVTDTLGCFLTDTFVVAVDSFSLQVSLGPDLTVCSGETIGLISGASQAQEYLWSTGDTTVSIVLQTPGEYSVTVSNAIGCVAQDTVNVIFQGYKPVAGFVADSVCFGLLTSFTDTSSATAPDAIGSWLWTIDGLPFTEQNPQYLFPDPGNHQVQLYVETDSGCYSTATQSVFVIPNPVVSFLPMMGCSEKPVQFNNQTTIPWGSVFSWEWWATDTNDVIIASSAATHALFTFDQPMMYDVWLVASTSDGCRDTLTQPLEIRRTPPVDFSWSNICIGQTTAFTETTQVLPYEAIIQRQWNFGDNGISSLPNPLHQYNQAGIYQVSLYNKSVNGCSDTVTKPVTIYKLPVPGFYNSLSCLNTSVQFFDTSSVDGGFIDHVIWSFPWGDTTWVQEPYVNFPDTGSYSIILTAISDQGCQASLTQSVQVYPFPEASFSLIPEYGIPPLDVSFFNQSTGADTYYWDFGDNMFSTAINPQHTYQLTSVYTVTLVAVNNYLCSDTAYGTVYVIPSTYDVAVTDVEQVSSGGMMTSVVKVRNFGSRIVRSLRMSLQVDNGMPVTEIWEGLMDPGSEIYFTFNSLLEEGDLSARKMICYSALPDEDVEDVNVSNNTWCHILDPGFYIMSVSPNPAGNEVFIDFVMNSTEEFGIQLSGTDGRIVADVESLQGSEGMNRLRLDLTHINQGVYTVRIYTANEQILSKIAIVR